MDVVHLTQKQLAARWHLSEACLERWRSEGFRGVKSLWRFPAAGRTGVHRLSRHASAFRGQDGRNASRTWRHT